MELPTIRIDVQSDPEGAQHTARPRKKEDSTHLGPSWLEENLGAAKGNGTKRVPSLDLSPMGELRRLYFAATINVLERVHYGWKLASKARNKNK